MEIKGHYQTENPDPIKPPETPLESEIFEIADLLDRIDLKLKRSIQAGNVQDIQILGVALTKVGVKLSGMINDLAKHWRS